MLRNYEVNSIFSKTITLESLQEKIDSYNPNSDRELIKKAYDFSVDAHSGQSRLSGEPYIKGCDPEESRKIFKRVR